MVTMMMNKQTLWYSMIFLINMIFIMICISYAQSTVYQTMMKVNERLGEIDQQLIKLSYSSSPLEHSPPIDSSSITDLHSALSHLQANLDHFSSQMRDNQDQQGREQMMMMMMTEQMKGYLEQMMEQMIGYMEQMEGRIQQGFHQGFDDLSGDITRMDHDLEEMMMMMTPHNIDIDNGDNNVDRDEINNDEEEKKREVRVERFEPIKDNHHSYIANLHMVMKGEVERKSVMGVLANILSLYTSLHLNLTVEKIDRMDVYYEGDEQFPNGLSIFYDLSVSSFYSSPLNPSLSPSLRHFIQSLALGERREEREEREERVCDQCRLVAHATLPFDFRRSHSSSFPSLREYLSSLSSPSSSPLLNDGEVVKVMMEGLEVRLYDPSITVNFITCISNVAMEFERILGYLERVYDRDPHIHWLVVDYHSNDTDVEGRLGKSKVPHTVIQQEGKFNKVKGLNAAADAVTSPNEILFFLDVDMYFDDDFSQVIRSRTYQGEQVFYPVCYSFYANGAPPEYRNGFYREGGIGNLGIFKSDFLANPWSKRGQDEESWGREDDYMFDALSNQHYVTYRSYEPQFFHLYHEQRAWHS